MTELSREQIEYWRSRLTPDAIKQNASLAIHDICDMALAKKDAEADRDKWQARAEKAWASMDAEMQRNIETNNPLLERAQRAEAECERLRDMLNRIASGPRRDSVTQCQMAAEALATTPSENDRVVGPNGATEGGIVDVPNAPEQSDGPKRGPANSNGDFYGVCPKCERSLGEHVTFYCPDCDTPEQAHGDALAALNWLTKNAGRHVDEQSADSQRAIVLDELTASGVPDGWNPMTTAPADGHWILATWMAGSDRRVQQKVHWSDPHDCWVHSGNVKVDPDGWLPVASGVPYIPEEVRRLPVVLKQHMEACCRTNHDDKAQALGVAIAIVQSALASAPAACEWKYTRTSLGRDGFKGACGADWWCEEGYGPAVISDVHPYCHGCGRRIQIAAAPTDGRGS